MIETVQGPWRWLRPLAFRLEAESAHRLALGVLSLWSLSGLARVPRDSVTRDPRLAVNAMGLHFPNPIGLAAGFDKDAQAVPAWQGLGFGFIEIGTVTALPQPGNPRPRLFRLPSDEALINRMGFNNAGAEQVARRLERWRARGSVAVPLGVNLGKSKVVPHKDAAADYRRGFERIGALADYVVINLSSPNTPGLRDLQRADEIARILDAVQGLNQVLSQPRPLLVKLAPDLAAEDALACARASLESGCAGLVLTNTTLRREGLTHASRTQTGGLSGRPLAGPSTALLARMRAELGNAPVLIGAGGIMDADSALAKRAAGADLLQIYTGLVYRGPALVRQLARALAVANGSRADLTRNLA